MKYLPLFLLIIILCFSCDIDEISSISAEELEQIISNNQYNEGELTESRIAGIDPDSAYYLALKAVSLEYEKTALLLSRHSWQNSRKLLREKAAELSIRTASEMNLWADAGFSAALAAAEYPDNYYFRRMAAASSYWQRKDSGLSERIDQLHQYPEASEDWELYLFSSVSAYRSGRPDWKKQWILMFETIPSSEYIRRGWDYLSAEQADPYSFFSGYENLINGKYLLSTGEYRDALDSLTLWLEESVSLNPGGRYGSTAAFDLEKIYIRLGSAAGGGKFFEKLAALTSVKTEAESYLFTAARLYRRAGWYSNAGRCLDEVIESSVSEVPDRLLWYSLDIAGKLNPADAAGRLPFYIEQWDEPSYFTDTLDDLCTSLVRERAWAELSTASDLLRQAGAGVICDRFSYITARAVDEGYLSGESGASPEDSEYTDFYYRILNLDQLGELSVFHPDSGAEVSIDELNPAEAYISGLIRWDLDDILLDEIREYRDELSESFLLYCAGEAIRRLEHLDSIRMMYQYQDRLSIKGLAGLYPDIYRHEIEYAADLNNIPPQLLFALVWKESGFEREIVSRSGAVGLCQLMPATAEDVASRMRLDIPDLNNPEENLLTGSWYLNWLNGYVGDMASAVLSYNGGPGRIKRWMKEYSDLPPDLFYEAVPVAETHKYGKKVLTASVLYGLLYYNIQPLETLGIFFPDLAGGRVSD